jgi:hypothetical protein
MVSIDATILGLTTYKEMKEARKEQHEWHQAEVKAASAIKDGVDQLNQGQENQERQQDDTVYIILQQKNPKPGNTGRRP